VLPKLGIFKTITRMWKKDDDSTSSAGASSNREGENGSTPNNGNNKKFPAITAAKKAPSSRISTSSPKGAPLQAMNPGAVLALSGTVLLEDKIQQDENNNNNQFKRPEDKANLVPKAKKEKEKEKKDSDENKETEEEQPEDDAPIFANCINDLPLELAAKIRKSKIDDEKMDQYFHVLANVVRFTMKKNIFTNQHTIEQDEQRKKEKQKREAADSNLKPVMRQNSAQTLLLENPTKLYKKTQFAGKGGFGRVYYAKHINEKAQGARVAIKKMPHKSVKEQRMNLDEVAVLYFCDHPNIVKYHHSYLYDDEIALIMEYLEGGSLSQACKRFTFTESHIAHIAREMLKGISYLHTNHLVHRDLKSANVMLSIKAEIKLIDFGLTVDASMCKVHMVGSPFWMPPEMIQNKPHGYPADIWSFAICLMEMADKKPPHRKSRVKAMFISGTEGLAPYVIERQPHYSQEFSDFLLLCLNMDPSQRATTEQLLQHPFLTKAATLKTMEGVLREIFLTVAFENSGLFI